MCHSKGVQLTPLAHIHFSHQHSALPGACPGAQFFTISQGLPAAQPASRATPATCWKVQHAGADAIPVLCLGSGIGPRPEKQREHLEVLCNVAFQALVCLRG